MEKFEYENSKSGNTNPNFERKTIPNNFDLLKLTEAKNKAELEAQKYKHLYDIAPFGIFTLSINGKIDELNNSGAKLLGKKRSELVDCEFQSFVISRSRAAFTNFLRTVVYNKSQETCEIELNIKSKPNVILSVTGNVSGNGKQCCLFVQEISEIKELEFKLHESDRKLTDSQEMSKVGYWKWDIASGDCEWSEETYHIFHLDPKTFTPKLDSIMELSPWPGDNERDQEIIQEAIKNRKPGHFEQRFLYPDGGIGCYYSNFRGVWDEDDNLITMMGTIQDITERKAAEEILQLNQERLKLATEGAGIGTWHWNLVSDELVWSDQCKVLFGIPKEEPMSYKRFLKALHPDDRERTTNAVNLALNQKDDYSIEYRSLWKDGSIHWLVAKGRGYYDEDGKRIRMEGIVMDVSETKLAEIEIKLKNEELKKLNAEKDKFYSIIAHDLRSPFSGFMGLTQLMVEQLPELSLDEIHDLAISMRNSATNIFTLLENLLHWSRLKQKALSFNPEKVQLLPIVEESAANSFQTAKKKDISIIISIHEDLAVSADKNLLQTVIRNLLSNAVKFTPKGGEIILSAEINGNNEVEFSINDTGIGMSQAIVNNLFRLDVKANRKGTEGESSSGLGLLLCKEFVEKHGGKIWVERKKGEGSNFKFTIPTKKVEVGN